ncbi:MAG TPA: ABC transporter substrate-binding protein [Thermodesulfobacteriota bacterium]
MSRLVGIALALALLGLGLPAPGAAQAPRQIVMGIETDPRSLNPVLFRGGTEFDLLWQIFDSLFELGPDLVPRPVLAESVQVSRDGLTYTIRLKAGVTWHDGKPFTAEDVAFTIREHLNPANASSWRSNFHAFVGFPELTAKENPVPYDALPKKPVEVLDRHTVRLNLRYPYAPLLTVLVSPQGGILPKHLLEGKNLNTAEFNRKPIGTGPFRLVEWRRGDRLVLEANPDYHRGRPPLDRVIMQIIPEMTVRLTQLESGGIQFLRSPAPDAIPAIRKNPRLSTLFGEDVNFRGILFQLKHPALADKRVRQAIAFAIDTKTIRETLGRGYMTEANGPIPPNSWAYTTKVKPTPYDPERARRLLAEAGYTAGRDGVLEKDGRRLSLGLVVEAYENLVDVAAAIQQQLKAVGVQVSVEPLEFGAWSDRFMKGAYDLLLIASAGSVDPDPINYSLFRTGQPRNTNGYSNPRVDDLLDRARSARTQTERKALYAEFVEILDDEKPIHVLYHQQRWYAFDRRYKGFEHLGVSAGVLQSLRRVRFQP